MELREKHKVKKERIKYNVLGLREASSKWSLDYKFESSTTNKK